MSANQAPQQPLLVVTDLMGTTLRDDGAVLPAYRAAFAECAIPFTEEELATKRGAHKLSLFTEFAARRYPPEEAARCAAAALEVFESQLRHFLATGGGTPIAGAEDAIARLRNANVPEALIARMLGQNAAAQFRIAPASRVPGTGAVADSAAAPQLGRAGQGRRHTPRPGRPLARPGSLSPAQWKRSPLRS